MRGDTILFPNVSKEKLCKQINWELKSGLCQRGHKITKKQKKTVEGHKYSE